MTGDRFGGPHFSYMKKAKVMTLDRYNRIPKLSNVFLRAWINRHPNDWAERLRSGKCDSDFWYVVFHYTANIEFYTIGRMIEC